MDMRTLHLPRFGRRAAVAVSVAALASGGGIAYAAVTVCPTQNNPSNKQLQDYEKCRLDAIETKVDAILAKPAVTTTVTAAPTTVTVTASPTSSATSATTTTSATTSATTTTTASVTTTTTTAPPPSNGFPNDANTGVPAGTVLTVVPGDYTVSTANATVDALDIRGTLHVNADGVTVTRVKVGNTVTSDTGYRSFTITDSELHSGSVDFKVFSLDGNFTALRNEISGGNSGGMCSDCFLKDNWIHNPTVLASNDTHHMSAFRMRQRATFVHNTIACEVKQSAADGGCSAGLTGYGDFEPVTNNLIENNLFQAMPYASFCAYGGASGGKPYSGQDHDIVFRNNVFEKGTTGKCAVFAVIGDFDANRPGNQLVGNAYSDGTPITLADVG